MFEFPIHRSDFCLDAETSKLALPLGDSTSRAELLLEWLQKEDANTLEILSWLVGKFPIFSKETESPSIAILRSLPSYESPVYSKVRDVLGERIAEVIEWLAVNPMHHRSIAEPTWMELVNLTEAASGLPAIANALENLRLSFDNAAGDKFQFSKNRKFRYFFSKLVMEHQRDNLLFDRWKHMLDGGEDPVLKLPESDCVRAIMLMADEIAYPAFESTVGIYYKSLDKKKSAVQEKLNAANYLESTARNYCPQYKIPLKLANARLTTSFDWLPHPGPILNVIASATDPAVVRQLTNSSSHKEIAMYRYRNMIKAPDYSDDYVEYVTTEYNSYVANSCQDDSAGLESGTYCKKSYEARKKTQKNESAMKLYAELAIN